MIVLILHNFPEGIITFISSLKDPTLGLRIGIAIIMHNIPEGISIAIPIYYSTKSKKKAIFNAFLSGISEPLGALFAYLFLSGYFNTNLLSYLLIIVSGMMISLSINEILPVCISYNNSKYVYSGLLLGLLILIINLLL